MGIRDWVLGGVAAIVAAYMGWRLVSQQEGSTLGVSKDLDRNDYVAGGAHNYSDDSYPFNGPYSPGSTAMISLFSAAAHQAGVPAEWASSSALSELVRKESGGYVGRPNYTFGVASVSDSDVWPAVWAGLQDGKKWTVSTATGLGQLIRSNVKKYYPSGMQGIGVPTEEAVGMLLYIQDRYGSPEVAAEMHGKSGTYVHAVTGNTVNKTFTEGY